MSDLDEIFSILENICEIIIDNVPYAEEPQTSNAHTLNDDQKCEPPTDKTSRDPQTADDYSIINETSFNYFKTSDCQSTNVDSSVSELPSTVFEKESSYVADKSGASTDDDAQYSTTEEELLKTENASSDVVDKALVQQISETAVQDDDVAVAVDEEQEPKDSCTTIVEEPPLDWPGKNEKKPTLDASESIVDEAEKKSAVDGCEDLTKEEDKNDEWPVEPELNSEKLEPNSKEHPALNSALSTRDPFLDEIDELFEQMQRKKFCFDAMNAIVKRGAELLQLEAAAGWRMLTISSETMRIAADRLQAAVAEVDIRVRTNYLNVFHSLFLLSKDFKQVMQYVFSLHFKADGTAANNNGEKALPHLHNYFTPYETAYTDVLRDISQQNTNFKEMTTTTRRLAFLLTISPRATLRRLVIDHVTKERSFNIVNIARVIRHIPTLFELRLPNQSLPGKPCSMMVALIYRFWFTFTRSERNGNDVPDINFADKDQCERMITLLSIFTTTRLHRASGNVLKPVFDPNELVVDFILPQLSPGTSHTALSLNFTLDLLDQLLRRRDKHMTSDESIIRWKGETQICGESAVDFGVLVGYVADNAVSNQFGGEITQKCFKLIRCLIDIAEAKVMRNKPENEHAREPVIMRIDLTKPIAVQPTDSSRANQFIPDINRSPPFFKTERVFHTGNNESRLSDRRPMHRNSDNNNGSQHSKPFHHSKHQQGNAEYQQHQRPAPMLKDRGWAMRTLQDTTNHTIISERFQSADQAATVAKRHPLPPSHDDDDTSSQRSGYGEIPANLFVARTSTYNSQSYGNFGRHSKSKNRRHNKRFSDANGTPIANENSLFGQQNRNFDSRMCHDPVNFSALLQ